MLYFISCVFGLIFGSFISVLVWRIKNNQKGILLGRSQCPYCKHTLSVLDLIPIFSYIFLKGKCRYCSQKISLIYPILEFVTAIVFCLITYFLLNFLGYNYILDNLYILFYFWIIGVLIVAIAFYDILFFEISFILSFILALLVFIPQYFGFFGDWKMSIVLSISGFLVFMVMVYLRKFFRKIEGMGGGDAIGAALVGLFIPLLVQYNGLYGYNIGLIFYVVLLLGFMIAGLVGIFFLVIGKGSKFAIPFLPFMFLGMLIFIIFGKQIMYFVY